MSEEEDLMNLQAAHTMGRTNYMSQPQGDINSLLGELTNPEPDIYEVELSLKGAEIGSKGEKIQASEPLLNDRGVANMIRLMRSMLNRVMLISNLEDDQIRILTIELGEHIVTDLVFHKKEYDIKNFSDMTTIRTIITYKAFECGMAALENGMRRFLKSGIIETTINTQGQPMKTGKGGLGSILGIGRK